MPIRLAVVTCATLLALPALAQPEATPGAKVTYKKVTEYHFTPEEIGGRTQRPDGVTEAVRLAQPADSLIRVRADFRDRLAQSAEDI